MKKLLTVLAAALLLAGCGASPAPSVATSAPVAGAQAAGAFKEADYKAVTLKELSSFWDREGSKANHGKHFKVTGKMFHHAPDNFLEGWGAQLSEGQDYAWIIVSRSFLTRGMAERFFEKVGSGTDETITLYFTVKQASSTKDRIRLDAVKRANGKLVDL